MLNLNDSKERMHIVVLILFLIFFVDPLLPDKIAKAVRTLFNPQHAQEE